jgi:hypothetical protein
MGSQRLYEKEELMTEIQTNTNSILNNKQNKYHFIQNEAEQQTSR